MTKSVSPDIRHQQLTTEINKHNQRYYNFDAPSISDDEYDQLLNTLLALEAEYPAVSYTHLTLPTICSV